MRPGRIIGLCPLRVPSATLVEALNRAGATGIQPVSTAADLRGLRGTYGVQVREPVPLPPEARVVVAPPGVDRASWADRFVLAEVTSVAEAHVAWEAGADGLIARGHECGGPVGEDSTPILVQRILASCPLPVWAQGGIGIHTAGAALALGAAGVVLDSQLALYAEAGLDPAIVAAVRAMDGSETSVVNGARVYDRPGPLRELGLPLGQDAAFARDLHETFPRIGDLVRGLERQIAAHRGQAWATQPLAPGSPLARLHGTRFPIVQGPMTRVSDTPDFALAVARAGALPMIAVSLLTGDPLRRLLEDTAQALGDLPWGVGMLGFAPPQLREEQLAAVRRARPGVALLAGGRPAQARGLEDEGIPTWLHVPSPGLLELFLKEGARRFVFEGRECGGHVGPRTSFVLWEQFVERLLRFDAPEELGLLFAGGIHDARSAAAVATLAAPLAVHGARVGVLMGTAYLFTEEAVATGAITPVFQRAALACGDTVLVHTAPGHATRCARSDFVDAFAARRRALEAAGTPAEAMWEELERLNLGRLRIAAKGLRREGPELVQVDEETVQREGMFMIGQVAALRGATTTLEALHREVSEGSTALLEPLPPATGQGADVAIVGMAGFFPGATDLAGFWSDVVLGQDAISEVPRTRWNPDVYYDPDDASGSRSVSKWGGFLPEIDFDPLDFGIPPRSLPAIDPIQLLALRAARDALADAGYADGGFDRERASVIFGAEAGTDLAAGYGFRAQFPHYLGELPPELDALLPTLTEDSFPGVLANVIAGRIANRLDLGGVNYTVDAACASSLAALDLACKELTAGTSDLVLVGGGDLHNAVGDFLLFSSVHALSPTGRSRPFDAEADGIALGEAVAVLVCKRLADAERDGDRVYAVIKGVAGSSDGRSLGLTAPRKEGQMRALTRAYQRAGVSPVAVGLAEAHGTGTVVGDRTELATLTEVFTGAGVRPARVTLGSVKSNVGHTKCAAGITGVIKCALALHHRVLPPSIHIRRPNPGWRREVSPFVFRGMASPWPGPRRHAAVSAFGFGGTNFHVVLASRDTSRHAGLRRWPSELFLFRDPATDVARVRAAVDAGVPLVDVAAALSRRGTGPVAVAVVADDPSDLREKLALVDGGENGRGVFRADPTVAGAGALGFLFPGQGSQAPGMLAELFVAFPWLQDGLDEVWADRIFPGDAFEPEHRKEQRAALTDTRVAQPALGIVNLAAARLLEALGLTPAAAAGHSYGELCALTVAGVLPADRLVELSRRRGELILAATGADPGTMIAVEAAPDAITPVLGGLSRSTALSAAAEAGSGGSALAATSSLSHRTALSAANKAGSGESASLAASSLGVVIANHNGPQQTILSGPTAAVAEAASRLEQAGLVVRSIPVACAFHSPLVAAASPAFAEVLRAVPLGPARFPVLSNLTAAPHEGDPVESLSRQIAAPVRFAECVERMYADGVRVFVEVGPGRVLTRLVGQILGERPHVARSLEDKRGGAALAGLVRLLAKLAAAGVPFDPAALFEGRARPFDLDAGPSEPSPTAWKVDGHRARPIRGAPPDHGLKIVTEPLQLSGAGARERVVLEYLQTLREQAESQRQVLLSYLGDAPLSELPTLITDAAPAPTAMVPAAHQSPTELLLDVVSERTGYPIEMLDVDLDLEADLSIDSIKRIEILGVVAERLGIESGEAGRDQIVERLAGVKTLRGILEVIDDRGPKLARYVAEVGPLGPPRPGSLTGVRVGLVPREPPLTEALHQALRAAGARVRLVEDGAYDDLDTVVLFPARGNDRDPDLGARMYALAADARDALRAGAGKLVVITGSSGSDRSGGAGVAGLVKSIGKEWPAARIQHVDLDGAEGEPADLAQIALEEIATDGPVEVVVRDGLRFGRRYVEHPLDNLPLALGREAVVLLTGGARGITARVAVGFATRFACTLILVGRSPAPEPEDPELAGLHGAADLRRHLAARGGRPAEIEPVVRRVLADREIRSTFEAIRRTGATLDYRALDVRDPDAVAALLDEIYETRGRIDWLIHGAGVNEDKLLVDKSAESFARVFDTKVRGAHHLLSGLREGLAGVALFSSVAGAFGNRGQADYAAANDALDHLARQGPDRGARVHSVAWGPWAGGGMVDEALARRYADLGIGLIDPDEGVEALFRELGREVGGHAIWMAATPEQMST